MSPIIYTPHDCEKPEGNLPAGTLYQCPECDRVWEADRIPSVSKRGGACVWYLVEDPRHDAALRAASTRAARPVTPATPTINPDMVQLALDTYWNHAALARDESGMYTECAECGTSSYGVHAIKEHAMEKAVEAVQDALDKAGRDAAQ